MVKKIFREKSTGSYMMVLNFRPGRGVHVHPVHPFGYVPGTAEEGVLTEFKVVKGGGDLPGEIYP